MLPFFKNTADNAAAQVGPKANFDQFERREVLPSRQMLEIRGGHSGRRNYVPVRNFTAVFSWNTNCGGAVPQ